MTDWIVQSELTQALALGALADRALLVISRYIREHEVSDAGREVLLRLRGCLEESQAGARAASEGTICAASIEALTASVHVRAALERSRPPEEATPPRADDVAKFIGTLRELESGEHPGDQDVNALLSFLRDLGKQTLDRETQLLSSMGSGPWM
jgi:hypothetical protein